MTPNELEAVLQRLQAADPASRKSRKRELLASARDPIVALHQRGYSWRSLARELTATLRENISADLLRKACAQNRQRRATRRATVSPTPATSVPSAPKVAAPASPERFGAKGLKL